MAPPLTARERAHLKARAHGLAPVVIVGQGGVTPSVVAETDRALTAHELIKVRVDATDRGTRAALGDELAATAGAVAVHRIGKLVILWRPRPLDEAR
jgi:RNA-binding protein